MRKEFFFCFTFLLVLTSFVLAQFPTNFESSLVPNLDFDAVAYVGPEAISLLMPSISRIMNLSLENLTYEINSLVAWLSPVENSEVVGFSIEFANKNITQNIYERIENPDVWKYLDENTLYLIYGNFSEGVREKIVSGDFIYLKDKIPEVYSLPILNQNSISIGYIKVSDNLINFVKQFADEDIKDKLGYIKLLGIDYTIFNVYSSENSTSQGFKSLILIKSKYPKFLVDLVLRIAPHFTPLEKVPEGYRIPINEITAYLKTKGDWFSKANIFASVGSEKEARQLINSV